jgi:hypothetical protein
MSKIVCRCEAPPHGYTVFGVEGRYLAVRLYPDAMGIVLGGKFDGVKCVQKWPRQRVRPAVPEEWPPWRHPILKYIDLVALIMQWPPNGARCTMTRASRSLTRRHVSRVPSQ